MSDSKPTTPRNKLFIVIGATFVLVIALGFGLFSFDRCYGKARPPMKFSESHYECTVRGWELVFFQPRDMSGVTF